MKYRLQFYVPGHRGYDVAHAVEADEPFHSINRGDIVNIASWPPHTASSLERAKEGFSYGIALRVTGVEHFIGESDGRVMTHALGIFTEAISNVAESRP